MPIDLDAAADFMTANARLLDRRRFDLITGRGDAADAVSALDAYANAGGGYGWALEPDLRTRDSQPVCALHAFEVFEDIAPATSPRAAELCDWLWSVTLPDGGLPFALPVTGETAGTAPFWLGDDGKISSLHMTAMLAGIAHRVGAHDPAVARHSWLARATEYVLGEVARLDEPGGALELKYVLQFLDAVHDTLPEAVGHLARLGKLLPDSGTMPVEGGAEDEGMRPLDFSPAPGRPLRDLLAPGPIEADLERLTGEQRQDGGWTVDWAARSPAGALEWRGWATVRAVGVLRAHGLV
ncbi:hypothetical protein [Spongiactinospora sp. TRM90649]|uniref:hypothetical protein n=1 Tax=Spongiactinospora sp. TRM90649 TaxID=3031114 RepID=UPI0023F99951|nr:hypothetical protein [Spongiactinospora sp. TRM90649]MDF5759145.1 hypothetical protein [Spongiactinospora sp. TRM90649]